MNAKPKSTGWWQTLPGILTATAAVLTAIGGLIIAFHQAGFFEKARQVNDATEPRSTSSAKEPSPRQSYSVILPAGMTEIRAPSSVPGRMALYKILAARLDRNGPGKLSLRFNIRITNNGDLDVGYYETQFRLLIDGIPHAPEPFWGDTIAAHSAKEAVVEFVIPDTTTNVGFQVGEVGQGAPAIPISLKTAKSSSAQE